MRSNAVRVILTVILGVLTTCLAANAQPRQKIPVIGVLSNSDLTRNLGKPESLINTLQQGLRDMGYIDGQNIRLEFRSLGDKKARLADAEPSAAKSSSPHTLLEEHLERLAAAAAELADLPVDVLMTFGLNPTRAAREATTIPIVFGCTFDPIERGLVKSLAQPGGNLTGVAGHTSALIGKQLEMLKEVVPSAARLASLGDPTHPAYEAGRPKYEAMAQSLGMHVYWIKMSDPANELERVLATLVREQIDAIHVGGYTSFEPYMEQITTHIAKSQVPAMYHLSRYVRAGGLMSYEPSCPAMGRRAGNLAGKILQGAKPAELPVELPLKYNLVINLKAAKATGITIPPSLLMLADEVIQ